MNNFLRSTTLGLSLTLGLITLGAYSTNAKAADAPDRATVEKWIEEYLLEHPEVIEQANAVLAERREIEKMNKVESFAESISKAATKDPLIHVAGNPMAPVTIIELFDYHCGYCKRVVADVMKTVETRNDVRLILLEYPVLGASSQMAALAATAALKQGGDKYMTFHTELMSARGQLNEGRLLEIATQSGLDAGQLAKDMRAKDVAEAVNRNLMQASEVGVDGTPSFIINGDFYPGARSYEQLNAIIDAALSDKQS